MSEHSTLRADGIWNDYRNLEDQIGNAREIFANILDDIDRSDVRRIVRDRAGKGVELLDTASAGLQIFANTAEDVAAEVDQMQAEVDRAEDESAITFAQVMLYELNGRLLTDDPSRVMAWILAVLKEVGDGPSTRVHGDATQMVNEAMKWQVAV